MNPADTLDALTVETTLLNYQVARLLGIEHNAAKVQAIRACEKFAVGFVKVTDLTEYLAKRDRELEVFASTYDLMRKHMSQK